MRRGGQDYSSTYESNNQQRPASGTTCQYNSMPKDIDSNEAVRMYGGAAYTTYSTNKKATCQHYNDTNNLVRSNDYYYGQNLEKNQYNDNYYYKFSMIFLRKFNRDITGFTGTIYQYQIGTTNKEQWLIQGSHTTQRKPGRPWYEVPVTELVQSTSTEGCDLCWPGAGGSVLSWWCLLVLPLLEFPLVELEDFREDGGGDFPFSLSEKEEAMCTGGRRRNFLD
ncbi:hypothetical protein FCM35_KLT17356 [Carex littledalei]|uniref:Uncharacterized protein n=1 Tax=Carex littledalei TaxID=544730 RepID=A0A833VZJ7_9POAL|nr:hypothetical protein FCM35_KLT17356 [Carex littledalei]